MEKYIIAFTFLLSLPSIASDFIDRQKEGSAQIWTNSTTADSYIIINGKAAEYTFSQSEQIDASEIPESADLSQDILEKTEYRKSGSWICSQFDDQNNILNSAISIFKSQSPRVDGYFYKCYQKIIKR